ncbi:hypothetical protein PVAP13_6KG342606 [Panicum virgatum]|uniref:Uncharacterized protein n=1 Tax=Panicum virgatum TaxID=38727 RepID=A0A8T0RI92_PANVG|nr:hypothetical protein PVAP13_6KG342606 [Panicum virgatum]
MSERGYIQNNYVQCINTPCWLNSVTFLLLNLYRQKRSNKCLGAPGHRSKLARIKWSLYKTTYITYYTASCVCLDQQSCENHHKQNTSTCGSLVSIRRRRTRRISWCNRRKRCLHHV